VEHELVGDVERCVAHCVVVDDELVHAEDVGALEGEIECATSVGEDKGRRKEREREKRVSER
jgi:hypothetical protein